MQNWFAWIFGFTLVGLVGAMDVFVQVCKVIPYLSMLQGSDPFGIGYVLFFIEDYLKGLRILQDSMPFTLKKSFSAIISLKTCALFQQTYPHISIYLLFFLGGFVYFYI